MSGIFSLQSVRTEQLKGLSDVGNETTFTTSYGYFGGGADSSPSFISTVNRLDFITETLTTPLPKLSGARNFMGGVSGSLYGYFGGGGPSVPFVSYTTIDRIDFSTETIVTPSPKLSEGRNRLSGTYSNTYGYFAGGVNPTPIFVCTIDRLDFSTETVTTPSPKLSNARYGLAATQSSSYGYFAGGVNVTPSVVCTIDRLDFSTETRATPGTYQLTKSRARLGSLSSNLYGYYGGGDSEIAPVSTYSTIDRLDFSAETVSALSSSLTIARHRVGGTSGNNYGYFGGGYLNTPATTYSTIDRLDFSTNTVSANAVRFGDVRQQATGITAKNNLKTVKKPTQGLKVTLSGVEYGYLAGVGSNIDRLSFSNETINRLSIPSFTKQYSYTSVSSNLYGYFAGGYSPLLSCTIDRLDFSNETSSVSSTPLTQTKAKAAGSYNSYYGYFGGGYILNPPPTIVSNIEKLDFSTETTTNLPSKLVAVAAYIGGVSSNSYGYFGGGLSPVPTPPNSTCIINRLDFSNETSTTTNSLPTVRHDLIGTQSSTYGYFTGGDDPVINTITRIDFSNDTVSNPGKNLIDLRQQHSCVQNKLFGYAAGGSTSPEATNLCTIDRLDFTTENVSRLSTSLPTTVDSAAAVSANQPGTTIIDTNYQSWSESATTGYYFAGRQRTVDNYSTIDRLDFSSETRTVLFSKATKKVEGSSSFSNSTYGYFCGGNAPVFGYTCTINRLDFSTETIKIPPANLSQAKGYGTATSSKFYGYYGGGYSSLIDRLDYSSETVTVPSPKITYNGFFSTVTNDSYGYFGGGWLPGSASIIERLDFYNETVSRLTVKLKQITDGSAGSSSPTYGYFGGGNFTSIERLDFSNESVNLLPAKLSLPAGSYRYALSATNSNAYSYFGGGYTSPSTSYSTIDRLDFTTETTTVPSSKLSIQREYMSSCSGGIGTRRVGKATYGYFAGGFSNSSPTSSVIDRLDFTTETIAPNSTLPKLPSADRLLTSFSNNYHGYFGGGYSSIIKRLDFSSETISSLSSNLLNFKPVMSGTQSSNYGYFGGGYKYSPLIKSSTIERLDFTTETTTVPFTKLSQSKGGASAIENRLYGYFGGGYNILPSIVYCTIDRLDFSTETVSTPNTYQLTQARQSMGTASNSSYGYFAGGDNYPVQYTTIDRLDFSVETMAPSPSLPKLPETRGWIAGTESSNYGYFGGGYSPTSPTRHSSIYRLDFNSETVSTPASKFTQGRSDPTAVSNSQ